ncbi:type II toxin-antitoxin system BrnA family antitoxin [Roseovarius sp. D22-M7]
MPKRMNVDFPAWVVAGFDRQARTLGITRQALIKIWIAERLQ